MSGVTLVFCGLIWGVWVAVLVWGMWRARHRPPRPEALRALGPPPRALRARLSNFALFIGYFVLPHVWLGLILVWESDRPVAVNAGRALIGLSAGVLVIGAWRFRPSQQDEVWQRRLARSETHWARRGNG